MRLAMVGEATRNPGSREATKNRLPRTGRPMLTGVREWGVKEGLGGGIGLPLHKPYSR